MCGHRRGSTTGSSSGPPGMDGRRCRGVAFGLEPCHHIHCVAVSVVHRNPSQRLTPEADCPVSGLVAFEDRHLLLHLYGAAYRTVDAVEHDKQGIATGLDDPSAVLLDRRIDHVAAERAQAFERSQRRPDRSDD